MKKPRALTAIRALMCSAVLALPTVWSYGQMPALQNLEFGNDVKGYSMERANPNNPASDYVMAGTWLGDNVTTLDQAHFVVTNAAGNILTSVLIGHPSIDVRPVDVALSGAGTYYVTCQTGKCDAAGTCQTASHILIFEMDIAGVLIAQYVIRSAGGTAPATQQDLFPVHTVTHNGLLYICGWADNAIGTYPYTTSASGGDKLGMLLEVDMSSLSLGQQLFWNTTTPLGSSFDFDMATRVKVAANGHDLLITGGRNASPTTGITQTPSFALVLRVDLSSFTPAGQTGISSFSAVTGEDRYGIDIWEGASGEAYVLFNEETPSGRRWGVGVLDANGNLPTNAGNLVTYGGMDFWANQALPFAGSTNDVKVVGQQTSNSPCGPMAPPATVANVNAFVADLQCSYNPITFQLTTSLSNHQAHSTLGGTQGGGGGDHLTTGGFLGDVSRHYTFAVGDDPAIGVSDITLATPVRDAASSNNLGVKFNRLDAAGLQPACSFLTYTTECPTGPQLDLPDPGTGSFFWPMLTLVGNVPTFVPAPTSYTQSGCGSYFRAANGLGPNGSPVDVLTVVGVTPNPAVDMVRVRLDKAFENAAVATIKLYDLQGREVGIWRRNMKGLGSTELQLPPLSSGLYQLVAEVGGVRAKPSQLVVQ